MFKGWVEIFLYVDGNKAKRAKERRSGVVVFTKSNLKKVVKYLLQDCYFKLQNRIFRQIIVITMGSNPAPSFVNFFLHYYERRWIHQLRKSDIRRARIFANVF